MNWSSLATTPSSLVIASNRDMEEWLGLFDAPLLVGSGLDRLANAGQQMSSPARTAASGSRPQSPTRTEGRVDRQTQD